MNEKDYSAIKKDMKEHIAVTVQGGRWMSFAKLSTGKWVAVGEDGRLGDFEILPDDLFTMLCIFHDSGRRVIFRGFMLSIDSKDFRVSAAARITVRDYSDYDSDLCHDGGHYAVGVTFIRHADGWERREYTSGDYCPYCGSFDCCGNCEEAEAAQAERLTDAEVMEEVNHYRGQADTAIMYQPA